MGTIAFTPEQQNVIDARNGTLLVSAAAGSGKTAVLAQRVVGKLADKENPQEINRLLIVTFTNAAAAQMKERISQRLAELLGQEERADDIHLQKQMLLMRNAPIMTIHSFCLSLLREFFYELELDPSFRIAEEAELVLLRADVMEELLERHYSMEKDESEEAKRERELFLQLAESVGDGKKDDTLVEYIEKLYRFSQSAPFPESWLRAAMQRFEFIAGQENFQDDDPCMELAVQMTHQAATDGLEICRKAVGICNQTDGPAHYIPAIQSDAALFSSLLGAKDYDAIADILNQNPKLATLSNKKSEASEFAKEQVKNLRAEYKKSLERIRKDFFFADKEQMAKDLAAMTPLLKCLFDLCSEFSREFARAKAERGILDFNDLEHYAVRLLVREEEGCYKTTETAKQIRKRFDEIMTDECQDSNQIQELLLWSISGEEDGCPNRFMVGDVKQSIYKFRMAKPELFMKKYEKYAEYGTNSGSAPAGGTYEKIVLGKNFRSRDAVVDYVNEVFASLMRKNFGGIEYDNAAMLYRHANYAPDTEDNITELLITETDDLEEDAPAEEEGTSEEEEQDKIKREAYSVAARIKRLLADGFSVSDGEEENAEGEKIKKFRKASYRDITVLLRTMSGVAESFLEVFSEMEIPAVAETQTGYYKTQEVAVALNALRVIDNPRQDIPFASVLHSELVGLSGEELAQLRIKTQPEKEGKKKKLSFFDAACMVAEKSWEQDEEMQKIAEKLQRFLKIREELCRLASYAGVPEVLQELYRMTGYPEFVRVKSGGERRCDNLAMLVEKAKSFEKTSYSGIFDFVRYIDRLIKYETDSGEAGPDGGCDAVRIMSIHKSKGLEAPIVIVACMDKKFNTKDIYSELVLHAELGVGIKYKDAARRVEAPTLYKTAISRALQQDMLAEELRVLYVAMTRAREKLILSAMVKAEEKFLQKAMEQDLQGGPARISTLFSARNYMDFLVPTLCHSLQQKVLVLRNAKEMLQLSEEEAQNTQTARENRATRYIGLKKVSLAQSFDKELAKELEGRKNYVYPYPCLTGKRKLSVSELKKAAYADEMQEEMFPEAVVEKVIPAFLKEKEEKKISASERGTLYHRVMECLDFTKEYQTEAEVAKELSALVASGRVRPDAEELVSAAKVYQFFRSQIGQRMQEAARKGTLSKEQPFVIGLPYAEVYPAGDGLTEDAAANEYVMVQGIIDAYFEEDGKLVLVDYKTDRVEKNVKEELTKRYRTQMDYYEKALVQSTGKEVSQRIIYAFASGEDFFVEREKG